jgi:hypothetical protein
MRWKMRPAVKFAFEGEQEHLRFVPRVRPGCNRGSFLVGLDVREATPHAQPRHAAGAPGRRGRSISGPLEKGRPGLLCRTSRARSFLLRAESDFAEPRWSDSWPHKAQIPLLVKLRVKMSDGRVLPIS